MAYAELKKLKKNSISTTLYAGISDSDNVIPVTELNRFYDDDSNLILSGITIGYDDATETATEEITITGASGTDGSGNLTGVTRGVNADGTNGAAAAWNSGTNIAVMFSTGIYNQIKDNLIAHESDKAPVASPTFTGTATTPALKVTTDAAAGKVLVSDADGDMTPTYPKRTLFLSGAGGFAATNLPDAGFLQVECSANHVDYKGVKFAHSADALSYHVWSLRMPDNYNGGTFTASFDIATDEASPSGNVRMFIAATATPTDTDIGTAYGTLQGVTISDVDSSNNRYASAETPAITPGGTAAGGCLMTFRIGRDFENGDTSAKYIVLLGVTIHYTTDNHSDE